MKSLIEFFSSCTAEQLAVASMVGLWAVIIAGAIIFAIYYNGGVKDE